MIKTTFTSSEQSRADVIAFVRERKRLDPGFRVIDVGGAATSWTAEIADCVVDINAPDGERSIAADICTVEGWEKVLTAAQRMGGFSYVICTHTLEDLYNPFFSLTYLPRLAPQGIITMPSIEAELSHIENLNWKGNVHHRWIFHQRGDRMLIIPKIGAIEALVDYVQFRPSTSEIRYDWQDSIEHEVFMNNYLGPNVRTVTANYRDLFKQALAERGVDHELRDLNSKIGRNAYKLFKKLTILRRMARH
jgi:hypothetical protein